MLEDLRVKGVMITVGPLLPWKKHTVEAKRAAVDALKELKTKFPVIKQLAIPPSIAFAKDNVHLTDRAAKLHYNSVFKASHEIFFSRDDEYLTEDESAKPMNLGQDQELEFSARKKQTKQRNLATSQCSTEDKMDEQGTSKGMSKHSIHTPEYQAVMTKLEKLKQQMNDRWTIDLLVSVGTKEDLDKIENNLNINKIVIRGLDIPDLWQAEDWKERIPLIKDAVDDLLNFINPGVDHKLGYVKHFNAKLKAARQIVEVTLELENMGKLMRKAYADKIKQWREKKLFPDRMNGVSITPSLTLATRVRIAILKAVAKMLPEEFEDTEAWIIQHVAWPVLKIQQTEKDGKKILMSYGFAQAMGYIKSKMSYYKFSDQELFDAYAVAGTRFGPEIGHHFMVLEMDKAIQMACIKKQKRYKKK